MAKKKSDTEALRKIIDLGAPQISTFNKSTTSSKTDKSTNKTTTSRTSKSSAPQTASGSDVEAVKRIQQRAAQERAEKKKYTTSTKKYTDYNTDTKNAYTSAKNRAYTTTTTSSNLTDKQRKSRINEIESELRQLNTKLSGISRAGAYGSTASLKPMKEETQKRISELSAELKTLKRTGTFTASELKQFEIDDAKARKSALPNYNPTARVAPSSVDAFKKNVSAHSALDKEIDTLERQKELYDNITKFGDVVHKDNNQSTLVGDEYPEWIKKYDAWVQDFDSQWRANYRSNELSREADKAMSEYIANPTEENKQIAYAYDAFAKEYAKNNEKALDDENVKASWLTKSMAGYLPQFKDQIVPELIGGGIGLVLGGNVGASIGAGLGTYSQSYDVIKGSVYRTLLAEGVDEETARKAAEDEALISSLIESGGTAIGWLVGGGISALKAVANAASVSVAKGSTSVATRFVAGLAGKATNRAASNAAKAVTRPLWNKALRVAGGVVGNALTEYGEEFTQGGVSIANREQAYATVEKEIGQYGRGNIDLYNRPIYKNADGSISTVDSVTFQIDDKFVVLPTIARDENGKAVRLETDEEILAQYAETGEYLGEFDTLEEANGYATKLHTAQNYRYSKNNGVAPEDNLWRGGAKVVRNALSGDNPEVLSELHEQGKEGFKIGLMMGGSQTIANNVVAHYANAKTVKLQNEIADTIIEDEESLNALIEEGKASGEGTVSAKIATEIETARANGKEITRDQVKRLIESNEVYIKEEERTAPKTTEQTTEQTSNTATRRLDARKQNNEPITVADVRVATGFGKSGAELVLDYASVEGRSFSQVENEVKSSYFRGFTEPDMNVSEVEFANDEKIANEQRQAFLAGQVDRKMQNVMRDAKAKNATIYDGTFTENEHTKNFTQAEKTMISTIARSFGMDIATVDKILVETKVNGRKIMREANASHEDGLIRISNNRDADKAIFRLALHEGGHRMSELAPKEFGALMNALYEYSSSENAKIGRSQTSGFDNVQSDYAGLDLNTFDYFEEFAVREIENIFGSASSFNRWVAKISANQDARTGWQKFVDYIVSVIDDIKRALSQAKLSKAERAEANARLDHIKALYASAYKATEKAVAERRQTNETTEAQNKPVTNENESSNKETPTKEKNAPQANISGKITDRMKTVLGGGEKSVGIADGQAFVTNGKDILPSRANRSVFLPVNDVEVAKAEFGASESNKTSANISKILASDFVPVRKNFVDGTLKGVGEVRVFTDENGREIALETNVAEYFEGYNLEATFRGGKPYAIKATDNDGNVAGVAMAIWQDTSGQKYKITDKNSTKNLEIKINEEYNGNISHSLKSKYNEYNTIGMQWAYHSDTQIGDRKVIYNSYTNKYTLVEATKEGVGFVEIRAETNEQKREEKEYYETEKQRNQTDGSEETVDKVLRDFGIRRNYNSRNNVNVENRGRGIQNAEVSKGKSNSDRTTDSKTTDGELNTFIDIAGNRRSIFKDDNLGYSVIGTRNNSYHSSKQEAVEAENNFIKSYYAKKLSVSRSYIDEMLKEDDQFIKNLQKKSFSLKETAPTFYSHMGKTIDGIKQEKIGANSVVSYLKGRGVKDDEIKWSGIETFLEGKKSVTKAELQEFVACNQLEIEENILSNDELSNYKIEYTDSERARLDEIGEEITRNWEKVDSIWEEMFGEEISWDIRFNDNATRLLIRELDKRAGDGFDARYNKIANLVRDIDVLESRQSYIVSQAEARTEKAVGTRWDDYTLDGGDNYREITFKMPNSTYSNSAMQAHWGNVEGILAHARIQDFDVDGKKMLFIEEIQSDWHNEGASRGYEYKLSLNEQNAVMDLTDRRTQLFNELRDVLEEIRKTAESAEKQNLSAQKQVELTAPLWEKANKLREEERALLAEAQKIEGSGNVPDAPFRDNYHEYVLKRLIRMAAEEGYDSIGWTTADIQSKRWSEQYAEGYRIEYDQDIPKFLNKYGKKWGAKVEKTEIGKEDGGWYEVEGTTIWSMPITDSMKDSVLYEGQPMYSLKDSEGNTLTKEQVEYFKDSRVRDGNGNLLVVYHGTRKADFTEFKRNINFFTDSEEMADSYSPNGEMYKGYLNITKPYVIDAEGGKWSKVPIDEATKQFLQEYGASVFKEGGKWRTTPADIASAIEEAVDNGELDYDGIIIKNIDDTGSYYKGKGKNLGTDYIAFNSNQFKNSDNTNPTTDPDIRFNLKKPVEETKNLVAVHNLWEEKLLKSLNLGGLPMPSIAIVKAREGHSNFGNISLVFRKDTISPTDRRNKVYSGDAWTPTYPYIEYKVNEKERENIKKKIDALVPSNIQRDLGGLHLDSSNMESDLNRNGDMVSAYRYNYAMKYAFLVDNGVSIELPTKAEPLYRYGEVSNDAVISFAHKMVNGLQTVNSLLEQHSSKLMSDTELINAITSVLNEELLSNINENTEAYQKFIEEPLYKPESIDLSTVLGMLEASRRYFNTNGRIDSKIDYSGAQTLIDKKVDVAEYEAWVNELFSNIIAKEGIRNDKDLFTPSGNRRSFEALHYEHTLENVVKAMKEQGTIGIGGFGGNNIMGASVVEYGSIEQIKEKANERMKALPQEEYDKIREGFTDRFLELASSLPIHKTFSSTDDAANMLCEAVMKYKTKSGMANYLRNESKGWANYSDYIVDDLVDLVNDIRNMPTSYFEAKPQRAVGFNEIVTAIIPDNVSDELKTKLTENNVQFIEYEHGNNDARLDALNSLEDAMFSLKGTLSDTEIRNAVANNKLHKYVEKGIITTEKYNELIETYGVIPSGEKPHRDIQVPRKSGKNKKVSQTVRTILEAKATPDEAIPTIEKMVEDGIFSYDVYTDKQAISDAESYIKEYGWDESLDDWFDAVEKGEVSKELTTMGWALYNNAANLAATTTSETERTTATKTSLKILDAIVRHQRSAAQALQATRILKTLSPETQLYAVQKSVSALQNELANKYGDKAPDLQINEELAEQFITAETAEERAEIEKEIYKDIGRQMPSRFIDKWNAWRYLAMLGNPRTHIRNIVGNAGFAPIVLTKDLTATAIESIVHRVSGGKTVRGKSIVWGSKADRELLKAAWGDYANVADMISNGGKYNDFAMANQQIEKGRQIFKLKPLEWARKGNSYLLETEDMLFSLPHYAYALAQYCKANNITAEQIKKGKAIAPARDYAIKEAQKATYRDTNAFSQMVSEWGRNKNETNPVKKVFNTVIEGILPFRKTPANILVRGVEYSPLGLLKGLSYDLVQVSKGKMSASEAIDNISAGLTGTGLLALGVFLAAQGLVRGHGEDDEDEKKFKEMMGHQAYSLELPNGESTTLDWLAPEALPFFVGVNLYETTRGADKELNLSTILQAVSNISEPMLEMSCLQGLNDLFEGIGYASSNDTSGLVSVISSAITSYLTQGIPTLSGQAERTGEENRMTTYTEKNGFLTGDMQYTLGKASAKIPFWDYNQIPYIDAWGRKEASGTALKRGLNNFLNPAYTSTIETSKMEEELLRLYEATGESGVFPERADKYFTVDGSRKDLTADEYVRYATLKGNKSLKAVTDLVNSRAYKKLSDGEKAKAITEVYDYANQKAKETISNYKPDTWVSKADEFSNVGNYISFKTEVSGTKEDNGGKISKSEVVDIILDMAENDPDTWNMYLSMYDSTSDMYAYNKGIDGETYMNFIDSLNDVDTPTKSGKYGTYTQKEATAAINQLEGLSRQEKAILWQSVNTNWKKNPFR